MEGIAAPPARAISRLEALARELDQAADVTRPASERTPRRWMEGIAAPPARAISRLEALAREPDQAADAAVRGRWSGPLPIASGVQPAAKSRQRASY